MNTSYFGDQNIDETIRNRYFPDFSYKGTIVEVFSSLKVKDSYRQIANNWVDRLKHTMIKVNVRKLDTIIKDYQIENIDILSVDVEGWELEVMKGLSLINPKVVILENLFKEESYRQYMIERGYKFIEKIWDNDIYEKEL